MNAQQMLRLKQIGKNAFIREEMVRLGFWPPDEATARDAEAAETELSVLYDKLAITRAELDEVEAKIAEVGDIPQLIAGIRKRRIERVRAERIVKREERAKAREAKQAADKEWRRETLPFLGRGVSAGLIYDGGDPERLAALSLPVLNSAADVAAHIGIETRELAWLTYHRGAAMIDHYHRFEIPKRRGGTRTISSPKSRLRVAQRWLLEKILAPLPVHEAAAAFRPGASIVDNAARHPDSVVLIRIDLKDFFPSIRLPRVKRLFQSFGYSEGVATLMALLATEAPRAAITLDGDKRHVAIGERCLPQGACTSPAITNLLCRRLDARLGGAAEAMGFRYSRYADDLVFSHTKRDAPAGMMLDLARRILTESGFVVNEEKTAVLRPQHRQVVTGVVVNETPHVSRQDIRRFRAFLHQCDRDGFDTVSARTGRDARAYAAGYLAFVHMVSPEQAARLRARHSWLPG